MERYVGLHTGMLWDYFAMKRQEELTEIIPSRYRNPERKIGNPLIQPAPQTDDSDGIIHHPYETREEQACLW